MLPDVNASSVHAASPEPAAASAAEQLAELGERCFYRVEGWWTFELCMRRHVRQFHAEGDAVLSEFMLGLFSEAETAAAAAASPPPGSPAAARYHVHVFSEGTPCDITGKRRSTEVRFLCAPEGSQAAAVVLAGGSFIESIKEPSTCTYVLTFATPLLCKHDAFRVMEPTVSTIACTPLGPAPAALAAEEPRAHDEL